MQIICFVYFFQCKRDEFTCNDGSCIDLEKRCDNIFDCPDWSDEKKCEALQFLEENYRKSFPPLSRSEKTDIIVSLNIREITEIDALEMTFTAIVNIKLQWKDNRIIFRYGFLTL